MQSPQPARNAVSGMDQPGALQCMLLRSFDLPKADREVFLRREIHGRSLAEIAVILGISLDAASFRLKRAQRVVGPAGESDAVQACAMNSLANSLKRIWSARSRPPNLAGWVRLGSLTSATDEGMLGCWARKKFLEFIEVVQRTAPTVIGVALNIFR